MKEINKGILSGVEISEEKAEAIAKVADKIKDMAGARITTEEKILGDMAGAGESVESEIKQGASFNTADGKKVAEHGVLTGAATPEDKAKILGEVADKIEEVEAFEADGIKRTENIDKISDILADAMGVKSHE